MTTSTSIDGIRITSDINEILEHLNGCEIIGHKVGNPGRRKKPRILNCVTAFDIETSTINLADGPQSIMYIWQWAFARDLVLIGRTWDEFLDAVHQLGEYLEDRDEKLQLVAYVHNLSFEFQFIKGIWRFEDPKQVFVMDRRKILRAQVGRIDFRCSYIHSNMSLDVFAKKMQCSMRKQVGSLDYKVVRYPWTVLTEEELRYCVYDVTVLVEAIEREMEMDHDNLETIPLTSTGYVRRDAKDAIKQTPGWWHKLRPIQPDIELYAALREAFRGGNTHANREYAGCILHDVKSIDRSSSYPDVMVNHRFPMTELVNRGPISMSRYLINTEQHHKAYLIRIALWDVELKNWFTGCPYLARDKCRLIHGGRFDNGRILQAHYLETTVTDIDFRIIMRQYDFKDPCIFDSWSARYGYLPQTFRDLINEYYRRKTELKGAQGADAVYYGKFKNKLNSLYGMTAQNVLKPEIIYTATTGYLQEMLHSDEERLNKQSNKAFLPYQVGVWVTSWARWELDRAVRLADDLGQFVYCDTDSVKFIGDIDIADYNQKTAARSRENGAVALDPAGVEHQMGVYELDGVYQRFITWGAKKYAYEDEDGQLHVTVSGVNKTIGAEELERKGGLEAFQPGFVFEDAGGTESIYNDDVDFISRWKGGGSGSPTTSLFMNLSTLWALLASTPHFYGTVHSYGTLSTIPTLI